MKSKFILVSREKKTVHLHRMVKSSSNSYKKICARRFTTLPFVGNQFVSVNFNLQL